MRKSTFGYSGGSMSASGGLGRCSMGGGGSRSSMKFSSGQGLGLGAGMGMGMGSTRFMGGSMSSMSMSGGVGGNEKQTMINLNNRLSEYLQKVKDLEAGNNSLELQLKELHVGKAITGIDYSTYDAVIKPLREQILTLHLGNARLALDLDNATLAAKDFKNKFENEFYIRQSVEADIADLKAMKDEYLRNYKDLESEIAASNDELAYLKKNHEEELVVLRQQVAGTVSVDVDAGPSVDLSKQLQQMRDEYETYCKKNQAELADWYKVQVETQTKQTVQVNEAVVSANLQLVELRKQLQPLEIEFNALLSGNSSMEDCIEEINSKHQQKLLNLQMTISQMEAELLGITNEMRQKVKDYDELLCIKMKLESEIAMYKKLLDGSTVSLGLTSTDTKETSGVITTIKTETRTMTSSY